MLYDGNLLVVAVTVREDIVFDQYSLECGVGSRGPLAGYARVVSRCLVGFRAVGLPIRG